jgi:hypothetical protein
VPFYLLFKRSYWYFFAHVLMWLQNVEFLINFMIDTCIFSTSALCWIALIIHILYHNIPWPVLTFIARCCTVVMAHCYNPTCKYCIFSTNTIIATLKFFRQPQGAGEFKVSYSWMIKDDNCGNGLPKWWTLWLQESFNISPGRE